MKKVKDMRNQNGILVEVKESCRAYLTKTKGIESITFAFYSLMSQSDSSDLSIVRSFIKEFNDKECKLQSYLNKFSDLSYCIANYLSEYYFQSTKLSISEFLVNEAKIFDFIFEIALSNDNEDDGGKNISLLNCLSSIGLSA